MELRNLVSWGAGMAGGGGTFAPLSCAEPHTGRFGGLGSFLRGWNVLFQGQKVNTCPSVEALLHYLLAVPA